MRALAQLAKTLIGGVVLVGNMNIVVFAGPIIAERMGWVVVEGRWVVGAWVVVSVGWVKGRGECVVVREFLSARKFSHSGEGVWKRWDPRHFISRKSLWFPNKGRPHTIGKVKMKNRAIFFLKVFFQNLRISIKSEKF